jgi:hypothetical protein
LRLNTEFPAFSRGFSVHIPIAVNATTSRKFLLDVFAAPRHNRRQASPGAQEVEVGAHGLELPHQQPALQRQLFKS